MCTILYLHRVHPELPLIIAANRDEYYARPSAVPQLLHAQPLAVGGVDLKAGGTWLGANQHGIVVGLTNQRTFRAPDPSARSRGEVVRAALCARSGEEIADRLRRLEPARYNAFNLLFGDASGLYVAYVRPDQREPSIEPAPTGVQVLPNDRIGAPGFPRAERARTLALPIGTEPWPRLRQSLATVLGDHERPAFEQVPEPPPHASIDRLHLWRAGAICTHGEIYGTCSATIIACTEGGVASYLYAHGTACRTPFADYTHLLQA